MLSPFLPRTWWSSSFFLSLFPSQNIQYSIWSKEMSLQFKRLAQTHKRLCWAVIHVSTLRGYWLRRDHACETLLKAQIMAILLKISIPPRIQVSRWIEEIWEKGLTRWTSVLLPFLPSRKRNVVASLEFRDERLKPVKSLIPILLVKSTTPRHGMRM